MSKKNGSADLFKRHSTRHRGITYRQRANGARTYSVYFQGRYMPVEGGEQEAIAKQADLRGRAARGERPVTPTKAKFSDVAEQWFASKRHLQPWTRKSYREWLDRSLLPRFGSMKVAAITAEHVAKLIRDLEGEGLSSSTIENYLLPLSGTLAFAVRRGMIAVNPCTLLTRDDRPRRLARKQDHVWNDAEIEALIKAAEYLARQPASRYDYAPLLRVACYTGLRLGKSCSGCSGRTWICRRVCCRWSASTPAWASTVRPRPRLRSGASRSRLTWCASCASTSCARSTRSPSTLCSRPAAASRWRTATPLGAASRLRRRTPGSRACPSTRCGTPSPAA
jgi:hypothetical protein